MLDFDPCCLFGFLVIMIEIYLSSNVLLFSCNPIGQLCLGGPGYSSRTVRGINYYSIKIFGRF